MKKMFNDWRWPGRFMMLALAYYTAGLVGLSVPFLDAHITLIWAPTGIALAALMRWGLSLWPAIWLAAFSINLSIDGSLWLASIIATGNTIGPLLGVWLLKRSGFNPSLARRTDLLLYLILGVVTAMLITSANGVYQLWLADVVPTAALPKAWAVWWLGDAMGALVCGIPLMTFRWSALKTTLGGSRGIDLGIALLLLLCTGVLIFNGPVNNEALYHPVLYLPFFLLSWLAIRGGVAVASGAALLLSAQAVWATAQGSGPFLSDDVHFSLAMLWGYMATATIIPVLITVLIGELSVSQRRLALASLGAELGMWEWSLKDDRISHAKESHVLNQLPMATSGELLRSLMHPEDVPSFNLQLNNHLSGIDELFEAECRFKTDSDNWSWVLIRGQVVESDEHGEPAVMAGTMIDTSARKAAEAALLQSQAKLQQSEERYRQLLSNSPAGILNYDRELQVTYVNTRFAEIMCVPIEYMLGLNCHKLRDQRVIPALEGSLEGKRTYYEGEYCTSYGSVQLWISMRCAPVRSEAGEIVGGIALIEDITVRKRIEAEELRQRKGLAALNEVAALTHLPFQEQLRQALRIGNEHFGLSFGIVSEISGQTYKLLAQVSPPGTLEDAQCFELGNTYCDITLKLNDVLAISSMGSSVYHHHPCYELFHLESYLGAPVYVNDQVFGTVNFSGPESYEREFDDGDREFMRLLARWIGSAITQEMDRRALAASEQRLETIIETQPECVKVMSPDGELLQMNSAGLAMLEADSVEQVNQAGVLSFVDPKYREQFEALNQRVLQGDSGSLEFTVTGRQGQVRWLDTHAAPLRDTDGQISAVLSVTRDISQLKHQQQKLEQLAHYDSLTGLPNRALLAERMEQAVAHAHRYGSVFAVCYLDLDGFKAINDALGHEAGDRVLIEIAQRLVATLREVDTVSRLGGDEFVLLLSGISTLEQAEVTLERVLRRVADTVVVHDRDCHVSASIGVTTYPQDGRDPDTLLRHADQAMYTAKQQGKNQYYFYHLPGALHS
ncbi:sensor domain-containing diguanylate cyclase [Marinobacterium sediminicola]|uniref:PAS domain S-box-containing protein/diguanylate cyclase (GGDEF) domain-containing protein n=1 Tax=Marinobacterium sediminicola TaxID=518898 RepID=A0ABY1S107_9GAMM|nr:sensor domain-containing diguanylate cyclase [Marinobacterium sediminicola]ULG69827.1 diguanylate cyclase [Marinobacterium sediminicola]SMR75359.1 PAS domain S-box-containing protein/diguanylate cyclase (GGDEF) domain-containing protein [Marinobacterium sediminicola]